MNAEQEALYDEFGKEFAAEVKKLINIEEQDGEMLIAISGISNAGLGEHSVFSDAVALDEKLMRDNIKVAKKHGVPTQILKKLVGLSLQHRKMMAGAGIPPFTETFLEEMQKI